MSLKTSLLTAGILLVAGFSGGFLISNGSGQVLGMKPPHTASTTVAGKSDANEVAAAGIVKAAGGDDGEGQGGGRRPTVNQSGGDDGGSAQADAGAAGAGGSGGPGAAGAKAGDSTLPGAKPGQSVLLNGAEASAFLMGNTVDASLPNGERHLIHYASRGLRADGHEGSLVVKPWNSKSPNLCEPGSDGVQVCRPLQVRSDGGEHPAGSHIGMLMIAGDRWVPIYKGDTLGLPAHIPFVDSMVTETAPAATPTKPTAKGQGAMSALVGHAASIVPPEGTTKQSVSVVYFADDGRRVTMTRPEDDADPSDGLAVSVSRWTFSNGVLCQSGFTRGSSQVCSKPEAWGNGAIRLISTNKGPDLRLAILAETPKPQFAATN